MLHLSLFGVLTKQNNTQYNFQREDTKKHRVTQSFYISVQRCAAL